MTDDLVEELRNLVGPEVNQEITPFIAVEYSTIKKAADRIEELERKLAMEKQYFKEVNDKAWDVHGRVRQLEKQAEHLVYALKTIVRVDNPKEWHGFCEVLIEETLKILEGKND